MKTLERKVLKYWLGEPPIVCDLHRFVPGTCNGDGKIINQFVDGATIFGSWACMCMPCHRTYGCKLGTGKGQQYRKQPDGRWQKVGG
jgi:hypothetical protein